MLLANILIAVLSLFIQGKVFPERTTPIENELDTLTLPVDHPETVLAKRAMAEHGLCFSNLASSNPASDSASLPATTAPLDLAAKCD